MSRFQIPNTLPHVDVDKDQSERERERNERITSESNIESKSNLDENEQTAQHANDNCFI